MTQRTDQWRIDRLGKITASRFGDVMGSPAAWRSYAREIREGLELLRCIAEGEDVTIGPDFYAHSTEWGNQWEDAARAEYEMRYDVDVEVPGFILHPRLPHVGCSADGLVFRGAPHAIGGIEGKCPYNQNVHARTLVTREMPAEYKPQVHGVIWVCGLEWVDFTSFDPRREGRDRLFVARQLPDPRYIELLADRIERFWMFVQSGSDDPGELYAEQVRDIPQLF